MVFLYKKPCRDTYVHVIIHSLTRANIPTHFSLNNIMNSAKHNLHQRDIQFFNQFAHELHHFYEMVKKAQNILLISHQKPDGDTSGSAMAMAYMLEGFGKNVTLFDEDPLAEEFQFIPKASEYVHQFEINQYDLAIAFDGGTYKMFGLHEKYPQLFNKEFPLVNIDHHISNEMYGSVNFVIDTVAATTIMVSKIFRALHWSITPEIATCLLMGLYTDTGSLQHSNATPETFREAAFLLKKGGDLRSISKYIFQTKSISKLKLWGRVLSRISRDGRKVVSSFVKQNDFHYTNTTIDDLTGVVDYLNSVPNSYSLLLTEREGGKVKGSLRTLHEDIDLTQIAGTMGGGGHRKASGFTVKGTLHTGFDWRIENQEGKPENFMQVGV